MDKQESYDEKIEAMTHVCDAKIEELKACSQQATPAMKKKMDREIGELIANREAIRRGLLKLDEEGELCSSCPD